MSDVGTDLELTSNRATTPVWVLASKLLSCDINIAKELCLQAKRKR